MPWTIATTTLKHTAANGYRCIDHTCPCQSAGVTTATIAQASPWPLKNGSTDCAWCLDAMGVPLAQRAGSHGICKRHSDEMIARAKARKERRMQARA